MTEHTPSLTASLSDRGQPLSKHQRKMDEAASKIKSLSSSLSTARQGLNAIRQEQRALQRRWEKGQRQAGDKRLRGQLSVRENVALQGIAKLERLIAKHRETLSTSCPTPEKARHRSKAAALPSASRSARRTNQIRVYRCRCGSWHLTSKPKKSAA